MQYFPIFVDLVNKPVLVIGGGEVASRKVAMLCEAQADVLVVSPTLSDELSVRFASGDIRYRQAEYQTQDIDGVWQVWATTNNSELNLRIHQDAIAAKVLCNVVDSPDHCDFITPSIIDRGLLQVAISSGGAAPVLVRFLRELLETQLAANLPLIAQFSQQSRPYIKQYFNTVDERRYFWERFFRHPLVSNAQSLLQLQTVFEELLNTENNFIVPPVVVFYPQDPELLTLKALRLMQQAERVISTKHCPKVISDLCRRDANRSPIENSDEWLSVVEQFPTDRIVILAAYDEPCNLSVLPANTQVLRCNGEAFTL